MHRPIGSLSARCCSLPGGDRLSSIVLPLAGRLNLLCQSGGMCEVIADEVQSVCHSNGVTIFIDTTCPYTQSRWVPKGLDLLTTDDDAWQQVLRGLNWAIDLAQRVEGTVLIRSGSSPSNMSTESILDLLAERLDAVVNQAAAQGIQFALQPMEEHFIHNVAGFHRLSQWFNTSNLKIAVDTAAMYRQIEFPLYAALQPVRSVLSMVTFRDPTQRIPVGDWVGQGAISPEAVIECLRELNFTGGLCIYSAPSDHLSLDTARITFDKLASMVS